MDDIYVVNFSPHQQLPDGWDVVWLEGTEHYHYRNPNDEISDYMSASKWDARRQAILEIEVEMYLPEEREPQMLDQDKLYSVLQGCRDLLDIRISMCLLANQIHQMNIVEVPDILDVPIERITELYVTAKQNERYGESRKARSE